MIMTWRDREGLLNLVICDDSRVVDKTESGGDEDENDVEDMRKQWYGLPDRVGKTMYRCNYTPDLNPYLPYRGW
jgi:hypothetical protein